jgi:two-component system response regulator LytT
MQILIIEDEELTAEDLSDTLLAINPAIEIVGIFPSVKESVAFLKTKPELDLIFSDIQLEDGLSFEIYERVSVLTPIVFCTAYNEYALEAFKANGIDYVLKPFARKEIETALAKYENLQRNFTRGIQQIDKLHELYANQPLKKSTNALLIYHKDQIIPIKFRDVAIF